MSEIGHAPVEIEVTKPTKICTNKNRRDRTNAVVRFANFSWNCLRKKHGCQGLVVFYAFFDYF